VAEQRNSAQRFAEWRARAKDAVVRCMPKMHTTVGEAKQRLAELGAILDEPATWTYDVVYDATTPAYDWLQWRMRLMRELMHMGVLSDAAVALLEDPKAWLQALDKTRRAYTEACVAFQKQVDALNAECHEWRSRWDQLDPQKQAEVMPYMKLLGIVMYLHGIVDVEFTAEDIAKIPGNHAVVFGEEPPRPDRLRLRWMRRDQADKIGEAVLARKARSSLTCSTPGCTFPAVIAGGVCAECADEKAKPK
jgi:hypothetical protein